MFNAESRFVSGFELSVLILAKSCQSASGRGTAAAAIRAMAHSSTRGHCGYLQAGQERLCGAGKGGRLE